MAKIVNTFETGLVKVNNKTKQPKNSYSYALNTVPNDEITDRTSRINEKGFDDYISLKEEPYHIVGHQWLGDEEYVFFIKDLEGHSDPFNEIWYVDIKEEIQELKYANLGLNFKEGYPITSTYRTDYRNHRLIYWVDGLNDDRVIDIDDPDVSSLGLSMISMNSSEIKPDVSVQSEDSGGAVKSGQYFVAAAYRDETNYITGASNFSKPVSISTSNYNVTTGSVLTNGSELDVVTNKKLVIEVDSIDTRYSYIILYIVQVTDTDTKIYTTKDIRITGSSIEYEFTGLNIEEDTSITINDLVVARINYYASNIINQKENRLIRGNLKIRETQFDYQQIANNIEVTYDIEEQLVNSNLTVGKLFNYGSENSGNQNTNTREARSYRNYSISPSYLSQTGNSLNITSKTFMRDEVYALGVSFELIDGTETNVFHIPGRALNSFVSTASGDGEYDRSFTNQADWDDDDINGNPRWLEMNTAIKRGTTGNELAYWRSDEVYPDGYGYPVDGEQDINGESYVRHHKMPSDVLEPIYRTETVSNDSNNITYSIYNRYIKLNVSNIVIPDEYLDIITKVNIHYVKRDDTNKSVVSKGLIYNIGFFGNELRQSYQFNIFSPTGGPYQFVSPDIDFRFKEFPIFADKFRVGYVSKGYVAYFGRNSSGGANTYRVDLINNYVYNLQNGNPPHEAFLVGSTMYIPNTIPIISNYQVDINDIRFADENSTGSLRVGSADLNYNFGGELNTSLFSGISGGPVLIIEPSDYPELNFETSNATNLIDGFDYMGTQTSGVSVSNEILYDSVMYGTLLRDNRTQYGNPNDLVYIHTGASSSNISSNVSIDINNGDSYIDVHYTRKGYSVPSTNDQANRVYIPDEDSIGTPLSGIGKIVSNSYIAYIVETDLNIRLRNEDPDIPESGFNYWPQSPLDVSDKRYSFDKKSTGPEYYNIYPSFNNTHLKEFFANNKQLSEFNDVDTNKYENRLVYSDKQNYEDKVDNFRTTRANNYKDLPMDRGQITQSFIKDDNFFVLTRDALYNVYASNKALQTLDGENMTVGTGEFFGLEPVELISIKGGFGGTSSKYSLSESPYGYLFVDRLKSKSIIFNETLKDINVGGINEDYTLNLFKQFKELELSDKFDNPIIGPGIISIYDPRLHRFIITKKDYIALEGVTDNYQGIFNPETEYEVGDIVAKDGVLVEITDVIIIEEHLLFTTSSNDSGYTFILNASGTNTVEARATDDTVLDSQTGSSNTRTLDLSGQGGNKLIYFMDPNTLPTSLNIPEADVISINAGLFTNYTNINAPDNLIESIDLSNNIALTSLTLSRNNLSELDVTSNINLQMLHARENSISSINVTQNPDLVRLELDFNNISTLNITNNTELQWCLIGDNNLSNINLSNNPDLTWLRIFNNNLTSLDSSNCENLTRLEAYNNNITSFDFSSNPDLEVLDIGNNELTALNISNLTELNTLFVSANNISSINLSNNTELTSIQIAENNLTSLDISDLSLLSSLDCTRNENLVTLDISDNDNLVVLRCGECVFTDDGASSAVIDAIIIKMDENITSGGILQYAPNNSTGVQPSSASLSAYNSLVSKGCELQGKVPA